MRNAILRWCVGVVVLLSLVGGVGAWHLESRKAKRAWDPVRARNTGQPIPVRTVTVSSTLAVEVVGGTAVTMPYASAAVSISTANPQIADRELVALHCEAGRHVKIGQTLFEFENDIFGQVVRQREAALAKAIEQFKSISTLRNDNAASDLELRTAAVELETAKVDLALAKLDLDSCVVKSPIDGFVHDINLVVGQRIANRTELAIIHKLDPIRLKMDFPLERIDSLQVGQEAEITLDCFPNETFDGKVVQIAPMATVQTRVLPVVIEVQNPNNRLKAGITGFVRLSMKEVPKVTVPQAAIIKRDERAMLFKVNGDRAHIQEITPGPMVKEGQIVVKAGIDAGDEVVIYGHDKLVDNDYVNTNWRGWTRRDN